MFYSETLLSKTGPLARVWLSANLERKLGKQHVLATNIENSVNAIVDQGQAPLALRLSGQLLLGVVRIYSRKARYLLDDCNEAIHKIKMVFRSGNVDLPANQSHTANPESLTLPDTLTELDLLAPLPDPSLLLSQPFDGPEASQLTLTPSSRRLTVSIEKPRGAVDEPMLQDDVGLDLDIGDEDERDIEIGRDAPAPRALDDEFDTTMQSRVRFESADPRETFAAPDNMDLDGDFNMGGFDDDTMMPPLNDLDGPDGRNQISLDQGPKKDKITTGGRPSDLFAPDSTELEEESAQQPQRAKKRKLLEVDTDTQLRSDHIRALQQDRSKILKPITYLPKDPVLLALMEMQKNGSFVSNILGDGRSKGWAPELRGVLSMEIVRNPTKSLKKRRDGTGPPQIEVDQEDSFLDGPNGLNIPDIDFEDDDPAYQNTVDDGMALPESERDYVQDPRDAFEHTEYPLLHPADSGLVSQGTKRAVHLLRERFGVEAAESPSKRQKATVMFQDLLPEKSTSRADATKMFFEVLVLATKDAIKVEQPEDELGGPLRVRGKRGLWGSWAEAEAGGEIEKSTTTA